MTPRSPIGPRVALAALLVLGSVAATGLAQVAPASALPGRAPSPVAGPSARRPAPGAFRPPPAVDRGVATRTRGVVSGATIGSGGSGPPTGVYRLTTRGQPSMSLDVEGMANADGTPVILYRANKGSNQQWYVEAQGDGTYKLYAYSGRNSLQMLDCAGGVTSNGTTVSTWEDNGTSNQLWAFIPVGDGYYRIVPKNASGTAQTLEIRGGNNAGEGASTDIWSYWGGLNQQFALLDPGPIATLPSPKKGVGDWGNRGWQNQLASLQPSWMYNWGGDEAAGLPPGFEFVPMTWGYYGNANNAFVNWLATVKAEPGVGVLLGFNEPDNSTQANLSVSGALQAWPYMMATGLRLGSPACVHADDSWMRSFMAGASRGGYRVDFVTIHWYGGNDPRGFLNYVDSIHNLYGKPVWITEFAPADWSGRHGVSPQDALNFMRLVVPALNQRPYVERYSWFSAAPGDPNLGQSALFNADGSLTPLGLLYSRM